MALFAGTFDFKVDGKGRVSVPAPFRAELETPSATGTGGLYLYPSLTCEAIEGCPAAWMEEVRANLKALPQFSPERRTILTAIFGQARLVKLDDDGRLVLPKDFAEFAHIDGKATFVGQADTFQIWEPGRAQAAQDRALRQVRGTGLTGGFPSMFGLTSIGPPDDPDTPGGRR